MFSSWPCLDRNDIVSINHKNALYSYRYITVLAHVVILCCVNPHISHCGNRFAIGST